MKKISGPSILLKLIIIAVMFLTASCDTASKVESRAYNFVLNIILSDSVPSVSVDSLYQSGDNIVLLDAREQEEYAVSRIAQAQHVGFVHFDPDSVTDIDKDATIVVYCAVGSRSEKITRELKEMGFENVSNLYGGIFEWVNQGYDIVNDSGKTNKIHAYNRFWGMWLQKGEKVYAFDWSSE